MTKGSQETNGASLQETGILVLQAKVQPRSSRRRILFTGEKECRIWIHTAPDRPKDLSRLGFRALLAATLACLMTGAIAGTFVTGGSILLGY